MLAAHAVQLGTPRSREERENLLTRALSRSICRTWLLAVGRGHRPCCPSDPARRFLLGGQPALGRKFVDGLRQLPAQPGEQLLPRYPGLRRKRIDALGTECIRKVLRRYLLV